MPKDQDKPTPEAFDLDALEREGDKPPFPFQIDGKNYTLLDPEGLDYREVLTAFRAANVNDFETALSKLLPSAQRDDFFEHEIPAWKLEKLFERYGKHFGLAPGKSRNSSRS